MANSGMGHYNFPDHVKGDTFDGTLFTIKVNGVPLDLNSAHIDMDLRLEPLGVIAKTFSSDTGGIIIYNPSDGQFTVDPQIVDVPAGDYYYDIEITLSNGVVKTYVGGRWKILQDITYD
jgi:hypothetical protein